MLRQSGYRGCHDDPHWQLRSVAFDRPNRHSGPSVELFTDGAERRNVLASLDEKRRPEVLSEPPDERSLGLRIARFAAKLCQLRVTWRPKGPF